MNHGGLPHLLVAYRPESHRHARGVQSQCSAPRWGAGRGGEHGSAEAPPEHTEHEEEHDGEGRVLAQQGLCVQVARLRDVTTA